MLVNKVINTGGGSFFCKLLVLLWAWRKILSLMEAISVPGCITSGEITPVHTNTHSKPDLTLMYLKTENEIITCLHRSIKWRLRESCLATSKQLSGSSHLATIDTSADRIATCDYCRLLSYYLVTSLCLWNRSLIKATGSLTGMSGKSCFIFALSWFIDQINVYKSRINRNLQFKLLLVLFK